MFVAFFVKVMLALLVFLPCSLLFLVQSYGIRLKHLVGTPVCNVAIVKRNQVIWPTLLLATTYPDIPGCITATSCTHPWGVRVYEYTGTGPRADGNVFPEPIEYRKTSCPTRQSQN
jgi:hypothetical protein